VAGLGGDLVNGDVNVVGGVPVYSAAELSALTDLDDGEEAYLQADSLTPQTLWRLRYNAAVGTYPWQFVGGPPILAEVTVTDSMNNTANGTWRTGAQSGMSHVGPKLTAPLPGFYDAHFGAMIDGAAAGSKTAMGLTINGVDPTGADDPWIANYDIRFESLASDRLIEVTGTLVVECKYFHGDAGATTAQFTKRFLKLLPRQIG
jgi:hypothetical protein